MSRLDRIDDWENLADSVGYDPTNLASSCLISKSQLRRYFRARFGTSPKQWLRELRLRKRTATGNGSRKRIGVVGILHVFWFLA